MAATHLWLEISMNVTEDVKLIDGHEHLGGIEASMLLAENARVVEKSAEVTARHVFHGEKDVLGILECIQEANKPGCSCRRENVSLGEHMANLVHSNENPLAKLLESAHLACVSLSCEEDFAVASLSDLRDDVERGKTKLGPTLTEVDSLSSDIRHCILVIGFQLSGK